MAKQTVRGMPGRVTVRRLRKGDDMKPLVALSRQFFREYEAHQPEIFEVEVLRERDVLDYFGRFIGSHDAVAFVATIRERTVGYLTVVIADRPPFYRLKRIGVVSGLMVNRRYRRRGVATRLLSLARASLRSRGIAHYTVLTAAANEPARAFYRENGMVPLQSTLVGNTGA